MTKEQNSKAPRNPQTSPLARRWKRGLFVIGSVAVLASAVGLMPGTLSPGDSGATLTHTVTRGNLVVSVTEQGTLESSRNTEIKCKVRGYNTVIWVIESGSEVQAGDELVRLDTKRIEDAISQQTTNFYTATATLERSLSEVSRAEMAIPAYLEGSYKTQLKSLERGLTIAKTNLQTAEKMLGHSNDLFKRGYVTDLEVQGNAFTVTQAELELKVIQTEIDVLKKYTRAMQLETLNGNLLASKSKLEADKAGLAMDTARLERAKEELKNCVIRAERGGLVIYPSAAAWKRTPDVTEGATVRKDQVLLLMPDLASMQVKVGVHESIVDRIKPGLAARITLPDKVIDGSVASVASVTRPAGWWNGNAVKYDTIIELPSVNGLKPGMSAEVEVIMDEYVDVLMIPVAAVLEMTEGAFCWVKTGEKIIRRPLRLGDTNDSFIVVEAGLKEGDVVLLNPLALMEDAQSDVRKPQEDSASSKPTSQEADHVN